MAHFEVVRFIKMYLAHSPMFGYDCFAKSDIPTISDQMLTDLKFTDHVGKVISSHTFLLPG